jgi:eukaryotic-like serine/threonine-protein kinase
MSLSPALLAGRYRLVDPLGSGGMGRVWLARDEVLHRDVAIKEVNLPLDLSPADRAELRVRTLREARTAARLSHPNVVQIYDVLGIEDRPWIVMEYVPSRSLQQIIATDGRISPRDAAEIGLSVLAALTAAHRAGVLHRDVKPGNVLVAETGRVVLTDFGLATFDGGEASVTRPGLVWGSPEYVAPERAKHGVSSVEADLWSLGATLFAAVEGRSPYARSTAMGSLTALATEKPPQPQHAGPLKAVLSGLLRKDPRARLRPAEVERMLRRVAEPDDRPRPAKVAGGRRLPRQRNGSAGTSEGSAVMPIASYALPEPPTEVFTRVVPATGEPARRMGRRGWLIAGAVVALVAAIGGFAIYEAGSPDRTPPGPAPSSIFAAPASSPATTVKAGGPLPGEPALPAGWGYHRETGKFRVGAPVGWVVTYEGALVRFQEPDTARRLTVEVAAAPAPKPMDAVMAKDRAWSGGDGPRNYQRKRLDAVAMGDEGGVEWEYQYDDPQYGPMQVICRRFNSAGRGFAIAWTTRQYDFGNSRGFYDLALGSFRPL